MDARTVQCIWCMETEKLPLRQRGKRAGVHVTICMEKKFLDFCCDIHLGTFAELLVNKDLWPTPVSANTQTCRKKVHGPSTIVGTQFPEDKM